MNESRRKPTTGTRCPRPTLFDKWHGIFYIPSRTDTAGHTKAFIFSFEFEWGFYVLSASKAIFRASQGLYLPSHGGSQSASAQGRFEPPTCWSTVEYANHQTTMTTQVESSIIPRVRGGGGAATAKTAPLRVGHPQGPPLSVRCMPINTSDVFTPEQDIDTTTTKQMLNLCIPMMPCGNP